MNRNELIIEKVRELVFTDKIDGGVLARMTQIEEPSLEVTSEGEEILDAVGSRITTIYKSKKAVLTGTNSLFSLDLAARQLGSEKIVGSTETKIVVPVSEIVTVDAGKITLKKVPKNQIKFVYQLVDNGIADRLELETGATPTEGHFTITGQEIKFHTSASGKMYVRYDYETSEAMKVTANTDDFPETTGLEMSVICRDACNKNIKYLATIISSSASIDPSSVTLALTSTGKHPFTINFDKEYCDDESELFSIIVAEK